MMNIHIFVTLAFIFGGSNCRPIEEDGIQTKPEDIATKIIKPQNKKIAKTLILSRHKRSIFDMTFSDNWDYFDFDQPRNFRTKNEDHNNFIPLLPFGDLVFQNPITKKVKPKKKKVKINRNRYHETREGVDSILNSYPKKKKSTTKLFEGFLPDSVKNKSTTAGIFKPWFNNNNNNNNPPIKHNNAPITTKLPTSTEAILHSNKSQATPQDSNDYEQIELYEKGLFGNPNRKKQSEIIVSTPATNANRNTGIIIHKLKVRRGGVAIAGPGGIATAGKGGTAIVGPNGYAYTKPDSLTIAGAGTQVIAVHPDFNLKDIIENHPRRLKEGSDKKRIGRIVAVGPVIYYNEG